MKRTALFMLVALVLLFMADCIASYPSFGPPALRVEVVPTRPGQAYVWVGGYWGWSGGRYAWIGGRWMRPRHGREWVPGRWEERGRRWQWRDGYWR